MFLAIDIVKDFAICQDEVTKIHSFLANSKAKFAWKPEGSIDAVCKALSLRKHKVQKTQKSEIYQYKNRTTTKQRELSPRERSAVFCFIPVSLGLKPI